MQPPDAEMTGLRIGLTGGIGSGKSTVAAWLSRQGAKIVQAQILRRQAQIGQP